MNTANITNISMDLYDISGNKIEKLITDKMISGTYEFEKILNISEGVYLLLVNLNNQQYVKKIIK